MIRKSIIFTDVPLLKAFLYRERFQLVPFFYFRGAPFSKFARHFPAVLEYECEDKEEMQPMEAELLKRGLSEDVVKLGKSIPESQRVKREILHLLTALTNYSFFEYNASVGYYGVQAPMDDFNTLSPEDTEKFNNQISHWTIPAYLYPKVGEQLQQQTFTDCTEFCEEATNFLYYYTNNPDTNHQKQIQFPPAMEFCLDRYFAMRGYMRKGVRHCISLLADGVEFFDYKRSVSTMATIASIEGMANIDFKLYGTADEKNRPTARFVRYLKRYVAGRSEEKYKQYYSRRGEICHDGTIFLCDDDLYGDINEQNRDWMLRLEIQQAARIALYNWLRRKLNNSPTRL
jgi:hypothetical protein